MGRPNVGKSSLFNWLAGRRIAIVDAMAGVTRDRVGSLVQLGEDDESAVHRAVRYRRGRDGRPRRSERGRRASDRHGDERGRPDPVRRRHPRRADAAGRGGRSPAPLLEDAGHPRDEQGRRPRVRPSGRRVLQAGPRQADRRLRPPEPQQEAIAAVDRRDAARPPTRSSRPTPR